jgi:hypothetical protein
MSPANPNSIAGPRSCYSPFNLLLDQHFCLNAVGADDQIDAAEAVKILKLVRNINMQFNCRTTRETVEALYASADRQHWKVSETLEHALAALKRELDIGLNEAASGSG